MDRKALAHTTVEVIDEEGTQRVITYHEIATHQAACQAAGRREFLEGRSPAQLARMLAQDSTTTIDENVALHQSLAYELFFINAALMEWEALHWLPHMGLRLTAELQADYDLWAAETSPGSGGARTRISQQWRNYRAVRADYDAQQQAEQARLTHYRKSLAKARTKRSRKDRSS